MNRGKQKFNPRPADDDDDTLMRAGSSLSRPKNIKELTKLKWKKDKEEEKKGGDNLGSSLGSTGKLEGEDELPM